MSAYVLVDNDVQDPEAYAQYIEQATPTVAAYGGRYLVRGGRTHTVDGDWTWSRVVLLEFPDLAAARAWIDAPELQELHALRRRHARSQLVLLEGIGA